MGINDKLLQLEDEYNKAKEKLIWLEVENQDPEAIFKASELISDVDTRIRLLEEAASLGYIDAYSQLYYLYSDPYGHGDLTKAKELLDKGLSLGSTSCKVTYAEIIAYPPIGEGDLNKAIEIINEIKIKPKNAYFLLSTIYKDLGDFESAYKYLLKAHHYSYEATEMMSKWEEEND